MKENTIIEPTLESFESDLLMSVREDLAEHLKSFQNESAAWASFEKYSGLNRKTLKGFLTNNRSPYPQTLVNFYKWKFKTTDLNEVISNLDAKVRQFLANNGYDLGASKKDITHIICKTSIHYEIYLHTEDGQSIRKSEVLRLYGLRGEEALTEMLLEDILHAVDGETIMAGSVRSSQDLNYYRQSFKTFYDLMPWKKLEDNLFDENTTLSLGNIVVPEKELQDLARVFGDFQKKICQIHARGLKAPMSERKNIIYTFSYFSTPLKEGSK